MRRLGSCSIVRLDFSSPAFVGPLTSVPAARLRSGPVGLLSAAQHVHGHGVRDSSDNHAKDGADRKCPSDPHGHLGRKSLIERLLGWRGLGPIEVLWPRDIPRVRIIDRKIDEELSTEEYPSHREPAIVGPGRLTPTAA